MAIKRGDLKVGDTYSDAWREDCILLFYDEEVVLLKRGSCKYLQQMESFLINYEIKPRSKNTIELVGFFHGLGTFVEKEKNSHDYKVLSSDISWKKISTRTIEIDE